MPAGPKGLTGIGGSAEPHPYGSKTPQRLPLPRHTGGVEFEVCDISNVKGCGSGKAARPMLTSVPRFAARTGGQKGHANLTPLTLGIGHVLPVGQGVV